MSPNIARAAIQDFDGEMTSVSADEEMRSGRQR